MEKEITVDAGGKSLGRVATQVAKALMGKTSPSYTPHIASIVKVVVTNAKKLHLPERKRLGKVYTDYSGYPGGLKETTLGALVTKKGNGAAIRRAVQGMLPRNTMRTGRMKRLIIND